MLKSGKKEIEKQLDFLLYMKEKQDQKNIEIIPFGFKTLSISLIAILI